MFEIDASLALSDAKFLSEGNTLSTITTIHVSLVTRLSVPERRVTRLQHVCCSASVTSYVNAKAVYVL